MSVSSNCWTCLNHFNNPPLYHTCYLLLCLNLNIHVFMTALLSFTHITRKRVTYVATTSSNPPEEKDELSLGRDWHCMFGWPHSFRQYFTGLVWNIWSPPQRDAPSRHLFDNADSPRNGRNAPISTNCHRSAHKFLLRCSCRNRFPLSGTNNNITTNGQSAATTSTPPSAFQWDDAPSFDATTVHHHSDHHYHRSCRQ